MTLIIFVIIVCIIIFFLRPLIQENKREDLKIKEDQTNGIIHVVGLLVGKHLNTLQRKKRIGIKQDEYGNPLRQQWENDLVYFIHNVIAPALIEKGLTGEIDNTNVSEAYEIFDQHLIPLIDQMINIDDLASEDFDVSGLAPQEFEQQCAEILISNGWTASITKTTGDQGADIIATDDSCSIAFQCKKYNSPVGNKAVQEIYAAKKHYGTDFAVVVTNAVYTKSAEELASATGVILIHHSELSNISNIIIQHSKSNQI